MKIILASQSPRRKEIMDLAKIEYEIIVSNADETFESGLDIEEQSKRLAYIKAKTVFDNTQGDRCIIGADTMVIKDGIVYEKPKNRDDAIRMLKELQGKSHVVFTSFVVLIENKGEYKEYKNLSKTNVYVKSMSDEEIEEYIDLENVYDKAGSYAIQSSFCKYIEKIYGDYYTVVGLPINQIYDILKENECL